MTDEKPNRPYRMQQRAKLQERTRLRITKSAVELHGIDVYDRQRVQLRGRQTPQ